MQEYPRKSQYKLSEVCRYTDTQPYVVRFWENEFPQLRPSRGDSGQPVYRKRDIDLVRRIKELLYDEEYTLAGARRKLSAELGRGGTVGSKRKSRAGSKKSAGSSKSSATAAERSQAGEVEPRERRSAASLFDETVASPAVEIDAVPWQRYQDAVDEIDHLRLALKEAEREQRKAETLAAEARAECEGHRNTAEKAVEWLERIERALSGGNGTELDGR